MNKQFTANEVRTESCKQGQLHRQPASDMLNAFADLLEAREKAVPVVWVNPEDLADPYFVGIGAAKEAHQDLGKHYTLPLYTQSQPPAASVPDGLVDALRHQRQIDEDGAEVGVSRQAVDEAANILAMLAAVPQPPAARVPDWTDAQCVAFMAVGLRHTEYKKGKSPTVEEIRQGAKAALAARRTPMANTDFMKKNYIPTTELRFLVLGKNPLVTVLQQKFRSPNTEIDEWRNVPIVEEPRNDDLDTLRPEVREAMSRIEAGFQCDDDHRPIRAELLRLAEYEQAAGRLAVEKAEFRQRAEQYEAELATAQNTINAQQDTMGALKRKLALSEGELAALKARIADGWLCGVSNDACPGNFDAAIYCLPSRFRGKRVRLIVEE